MSENMGRREGAETDLPGHGGASAVSHGGEPTRTGAAAGAETGGRGGRGTFRTARSRGVLSGLGLVLLGIWGGLVPFVGPYFGYGFTPDRAWAFTWARFWLEILPAAATVAAGLVLLVAANRISGTMAGWLATAAGAWFVLGPELAVLIGGGTALGSPLGTGLVAPIAARIGLFLGLGAAILVLAASATGRFSVRGTRDLRAARRHAGEQPTA